MWDVKIKGGKGTIHENLVSYITKLIDDGKLKPGELLPTQRDISSRMKVSIGTVIKAFTELENRGYVIGEVGRGTFVSDYNYLSSTVEGDNINLANFESPEFTTLPAFRALQSGINEVTRESELYFKLGYIEPSGSTAHKTAMAEWLKQGGVDASAKDVVICGGAHHGVYLSIQVLVNQGGYLMVEELGTLNIRDICGLLGIKLMPIKMDEDGIDPKSFEEACKTKKSSVLYIIPSLQNPTCVVMSLRRRKEIVKIATKYGVTIVEDAVNDFLLDKPELPFVELYPEGTVYVSSLSKTLSPGVRVGVIKTNAKLLAKIEFAIRATIWMNSPLLNEIATNLIESGKAKIMLQGKKSAIRQRQNIFKKLFSSYEYNLHPSAFHVWLKLPERWTHDGFARELLNRNVVVRSADMFYVGDHQPPNYIRIGLGSPRTMESLEIGLGKILTVLEERPATPGGF